MIWRLEADLRVETASQPLDNDSQEEFLAFVQTLMRSLSSDEVILDPDISGSALAGTMSISLDIETAGGMEDIVGYGLAAIRGAIHHAGGCTPVWPSHQEAVASLAEPDARRWAVNVSKVQYSPVASVTPRDPELVDCA